MRTALAQQADPASRARSRSCVRTWSAHLNFWDARRLARLIDRGWTCRRRGTIGDAMKLIRFGSPGAERPGLVLGDGTRIDVSAATADYDEEFFRYDGVARLAAWAGRNASSAPQVAPEVRLGAPVRRPSKIVCIGLNYRDHAMETGVGVAPAPRLCRKAPSALAGRRDDVIIPRGGTKVDWEVELGVVIGKEARYVEPAAALECIAGYAVFNDYSERTFQFDRGGQFVKGKSCDSFAPLEIGRAHV